MEAAEETNIIARILKHGALALPRCPHHKRGRNQKERAQAENSRDRFEKIVRREMIVPWRKRRTQRKAEKRKLGDQVRRGDQ